MLENGLALLQSALEQIPVSEKETYLKALERAPLLVKYESDPAAFLRRENYNAVTAARGLVTYWDTRRKVFGNERTFLPMTLSGAMAPDMEYVQEALLMKLPDDEHGRVVLHYDRMRCGRSLAPRDSVVRFKFYMMQVLCSSEIAQRRGVVIVVNYRSFDFKHFDRLLSKKFIENLNCIPVKVKAFHLCTGSGKSAADLVLPVLKEMAGKEIRLHLQLHAGSDSEILRRLGDFGLGVEHGRAVCGDGLRNVELHQKWLEECREIEREAGTLRERAAQE